MKRSLQQLANWLEADVQGEVDVVVTGVAIDSRRVNEGDLFIPFRGEHANGHRFVQQAIEDGAAASLWLKDEPNPPSDVPLIFVEDSERAIQQLAAHYREELDATVIGVTGSNGKTSTKDFIAAILSPYKKVAKTEGNFNNELGLPITLLNMPEDTEVAILEMGMSGFGEITELAKIARPSIGVITNIGEAHMEDLGSREGIARAKFELAEHLPEDGLFIYDGDEPLLRALVPTVSVKAIDFGLSETRAIYAETITQRPEGMAFSTKGLLEEAFLIAVYGKHQVKNALVALVIGQTLGLTIDEMKRALRGAVLTPMRMQPVMTEEGTLFLNDAYNAAPSSVRVAIQFMNETDLRPNKWLLLGDMLELGSATVQYHQQLVEVIDAEQITGVMTFGPLMRHLSDALKESYPHVDNFWTDDEEAMHAFVGQLMNDETMILVKGSRGMKMERFIEGRL